MTDQVERFTGKAFGTSGTPGYYVKLVGKQFPRWFSCTDIERLDMGNDGNHRRALEATFTQQEDGTKGSSNNVEGHQSSEDGSNSNDGEQSGGHVDDEASNGIENDDPPGSRGENTVKRCVRFGVFNFVNESPSASSDSEASDISGFLVGDDTPSEYDRPSDYQEISKAEKELKKRKRSKKLKAKRDAAKKARKDATAMTDSD